MAAAAGAWPQNPPAGRGVLAMALRVALRMWQLSLPAVTLWLACWLAAAQRHVATARQCGREGPALTTADDAQSWPAVQGP
jgi:hypothetical protein